LPAPEGFGEALRLRVAREQTDQRLPSISAAAFRDGEVVWAEALGFADVEAEKDATPETQYAIASITKTFVAASIMLLRDQGALDIDRSIGDHVEELPHRTPTLRALLSHLSGLQRESPGNAWETLEFPTREELLAALSESEQVLPTGERWHYSNLAFVMLGEVIGRVSGTDYDDFIRERLLEPLGMSATTWKPTDASATGYYVHPFSDAVHREKPIEKRALGAAGGLWSTTGDLARWGAFLAEPDEDVLARKTVDEMATFHSLADPKTWALGWGLGLMLVRREDQILVGHTGGTVGFVSGLFVLRDERIGAVALMNSSTGRDPAQLASGLAVDAAERWPAEPELWSAADVPDKQLESVLGTWWVEGSPVTLRFRKGKLVLAQPEGRFEAVFEQLDDDRFRVVSGTEHGELLQVVRDEQGEPVKLYWATYPMHRSPGPFGPRE
jgi:CubicO group peptidase (beta-lactamase class C family)